MVLRAQYMILLSASLMVFSCSDDSAEPDHGDGSTTPIGDASLAGDASSAGAPIGSACTTDEDCKDFTETRCYTSVPGGIANFPGGYCSLNCADIPAENEEDEPQEVSCGPDAGCIKLGSTAGTGSMSVAYCSKRCTENSDCRTDEGYFCQIIIPGLPGFCVGL